MKTRLFLLTAGVNCAVAAALCAEANLSDAEARPAAASQPTVFVEAAPDVTLYAYRIRLAARELETGHPAEAEAILEECPERLRNWEWRYLRNLCRPTLQIPAEGREVESVAFSPDGARLAIASSKLKIVDARDGRTIAEAPREGTCLAYSEDGRKLALAGFKELVVMDPDTAKVIFTIPAHDYLISCVAFSPDGRRLVSGSGTPPMGPPSSGEMKVWDAASGKELVKIAQPDWVNAVAFSPDGRYLASAAGYTAVVGPWKPGACTLWDTATWKEIRSFTNHGFHVLSVAFSPDGKRLVTGSADGTVRIWEVATGRETYRMTAHAGWVRAARFSPDGTRVASGGDDGRVLIWGAEVGGEILRLPHRSKVQGIFWSPDGNRLAAATGASESFVGIGSRPDPVEACVHDLAWGRGYRSFEDQGGWTISIDLSPDGRLLSSAAGSFNSATPGAVLLHEVESGKQTGSFPGKMFGFANVRFSPDGKKLAMSGWELTVLEVSSGKAIFSRSTRAQPAGGPLAFAPSGDRLATDVGRSVVVLDSSTGKEVAVVPQPKLNWVDLAFSPDGKRLALVSRSGYLAGVGSGTETVPGALEIYELGSKTTRRLCAGATCVAWSAVANLIAAGRRDGTIVLLDGETGVEVRSWRCGVRQVTSVDWSPDGSRIIGGGEDRLVRIWHSGTGLELLSLSGCRGPVGRIRFDPYGRWIAASEPQAILVWDGGR